MNNRTERALSKPFILKKEDFVDTPFNTLLASGDGKRLWVTMIFPTHSTDAKISYRVESLSQDKIIERTTLVGAISVFNSWDGKS
jgi:hypothetical protein